MTLVFMEFWPCFVFFSPKIEDKEVPGIYIYICDSKFLCVSFPYLKVIGCC